MSLASASAAGMAQRRQDRNRWNTDSRAMAAFRRPREGRSRIAVGIDSVERGGP